MSWMQKNYEKALLGGAAVIALGLTYLGYSKLSAVEDELVITSQGSGNNDPIIPADALVKKSLDTLANEQTWAQAKVEKDGKSRSISTFQGVLLYAKKTADGSTPEPVDIQDPSMAAVHPPIPNSWWVETGADPSYSDSLQRDDDNDGFANLEEFQAKTSPTNSSEFPDLAQKIVYHDHKSIPFLLKFSNIIDDNQFSFSYKDSAGQVTAGSVAINQNLFQRGPCKDRFILRKVETKLEKNERTNVETPIAWATIEDQKPNKKGKLYVIPKRTLDRDIARWIQYDRDAVLSLNAIGQSGKQFTVTEGTKFSLPHDKGEKNYLLKEVTPEGIKVEYKNAKGETVTHEIKKS